MALIAVTLELLSQPTLIQLSYNNYHISHNTKIPFQQTIHLHYRTIYFH